MKDQQFVRCDLQVSKNNMEHRTHELSKERRLFLRRGQEFAITLKFQNPTRLFHEHLEGITLTVRTGPSPSKKNGTKKTFPISSLSDRKSWSARVVASDEGLWTLSITTPASAVIGYYTLSLKVTRPKAFEKDLGEFMLLFNPWLEDDPVFLPNEAQRQEYVLSEDGIIYLGTESYVQQQPWHFGQFEEEIADLCIKFLDMNPMYQEAPEKCYLRRNDPIYVCRVLSDVISKRDEEDRVAFMVENRRPSYTWISSVPILQQWFQSECQPVYGHHWVFAAVLCTVFRCIGIPTRLVTNYNSAYNTERSLKKDLYYNESGARIHRARNDSIWNFHVWNECWMERRDLPVGYNGWQVIDATAQQKYNGILCCSGPAPVRAIKEAHVDLNYDVGLIFSKVVTDCEVWVRNSEGYFRKASSNPRHVGDSVSTKSVGSDTQDDITHEYKYPKGSLEENEVLQRVKEMMLKGPQPEEDNKETDLCPVTLTVLSKNPQMYGQDIEVNVVVTNVSGEEKDLQLVVGAQSVHDYGISREQFWKKEFNFTLSPREERRYSIQLCYSRYKNSLLDNSLLRVTALVKEPRCVNGILAQDEQDMTISKPELALQVPKVALQYQPTTAVVVFSNPLKETLEGCVIRASGKGLLYKERHYCCSDVAPGSTLHYPITVTPTQVRSRRLCVQLECSKFRSITGFQQLVVLPANVQEWSHQNWEEFQKSAAGASNSGQPELPLTINIQSEESFLYGKDISMEIKVSNQSKTEKDLCLLMGAQYINDSGYCCPRIWNQQFKLSLKAHEEKTVSTRIVHSQYSDFLGESNLIRLTGIMKDVTSSVFVSRNVTIYKPNLSIQLQDEALQYQPITAIISITNPLSEALNGCVLTVSGENLIYRERFYSCKNIDPLATEAYKIRFAPTGTGPLKFYTRFDCRQFRGVKGCQSVEVLPCKNPAMSG
ncbi:protein 4.2-like [Rhinophrynus dorsalis]